MKNISRSEEKVLKLYIFTDITADVNATAEPELELHKIMDNQNINRSHFPPDLSEKEILEILRDISAYISAHDFNPQVQSWVSAQRSLISKCSVSPMEMTLSICSFSSIIHGIDDMYL